MREKERTYEGRDETRTTANKKKKRKKEAESKQDVLARVILAFFSLKDYIARKSMSAIRKRKREYQGSSGSGT